MIEARHVDALEREIDALERDAARAAQLRAARAAASSPPYLHLARTVCRRAERLIVRLRDAEPIGDASRCRYVNRLSDALFVMSRHAARLYGESEPLWEPEKT